MALLPALPLAEGAAFSAVPVPPPHAVVPASSAAPMSAAVAVRLFMSCVPLWMVPKP